MSEPSGDPKVLLRAHLRQMSRALREEVTRTVPVTTRSADRAERALAELRARETERARRPYLEARKP